jgi:hypothetical protein
VARFRPPGSAPAITPELPEAAPGRYSAFAVAQGAAKPQRLDIRPRDGLAVARLYSGLAEIAYDRAEYTGILLVFASKLVKVRGRNLRPVVEALLTGTCEYIAERGEGDELPDDGRPVIEHIELVGPGNARPQGGSENA